MNNWQGKSVLITGVCGTVGRELLRQVSENKPAEVIGIDNNESELFFLSEEYRNHENIRLYIGDIRDRDKLMRKMRGVHIVLHAAALKHVILCEQSPRDAVQTNILGTQNIVDAALVNNVERVLLTSSDKAVNPTNVMGTSKLMCELLMTAANAHRRGNSPVFASTRFGNVLGSRGSVIPLFKRQIAISKHVTLTDPAMTRFIMTLEESVRLVMDSVFLTRGGDVFVTKMKVINIKDLAMVMINALAPRYGHNAQDIEIKIIGKKPGEKIYEELISEEETRRTVELGSYFVVLPAFKSVYEKIDYTYPGMTKSEVKQPYNSSTQPSMPQDDLHNYLLKHRLLEEE